MLERHEAVLLKLLAASVSGSLAECVASLPLSPEEWARLRSLAIVHGVTGLVFGQIECLPRESLPPKKTMLGMLGQTEYGKSYYRRQFRAACKLASALKDKGVEMKVLKGISFSTYYDSPELRECGDCDCYLSFSGSTTDVARPDGRSAFDIGNETCAEIGGKAEFGTYKHSHMHLDGLLFENHRYITDFNGTEKGRRIELLLQNAIRAEQGVKIGTSDLVRPCAHFNIIHLIKHAHGNFISCGMPLRMIYDLAVMLRAEQNSLDWQRVYDDLTACRLRGFADVMTAICVNYLGLSLSCGSVTVCDDKELVDKILLDSLRIGERTVPNKTPWQKMLRVAKRFARMRRYRRFAIESYPTMIWNSLVFNSYTKRRIEL